MPAKKRQPPTGTPPKLQAAHDRFLATIKRYVDEGKLRDDAYDYFVNIYAPNKTETFELLESRCAVFESRAYKAEAKVKELETKLEESEYRVAAVSKELFRVGDELRKTESACDAESAYWKSEAERHQQRVVDLLMGNAAREQK
jgi:hypothetical protein